MSGISTVLIERAIHGLHDKPAISMSGCKEDLKYHRRVVAELESKRPLSAKQAERLIHHKSSISRLEKIAQYWFAVKL
ncbi:MAG: hypothetical protein IE883_04265 [Epsilonproteobacteria bacterium]|nr:hypothetical protein [Campylobacterota bacterium]